MNKKIWAGRILSALPALLLLTSGINLIFIQTPDVRTQFAKFGYPVNLIPVVGIIELVCIVTYLIPRTAVLGAILVTGYLGGAVATHVRVNDPVWPAPFVVAVMMWLGLYLREERLTPLVPLRDPR